MKVFLQLFITIIATSTLVACNSGTTAGTGINEDIGVTEIGQNGNNLGSQTPDPKFYLNFYNYNKTENITAQIKDINGVTSISSNPLIISPNGVKNQLTFISSGYSTQTSGIAQIIPGALGICLTTTSTTTNPYCFNLVRLAGERPFFFPGIQSFTYAYLTKLQTNNEFQVWAYYYDPTDLGYQVNDYVCRNLTDVYNQNTGGYMQRVNQNTSFEFYIYKASDNSINSSNACATHN